MTLRIPLRLVALLLALLLGAVSHDAAAAGFHVEVPHLEERPTEPERLVRDKAALQRAEHDAGISHFERTEKYFEEHARRTWNGQAGRPSSPEALSIYLSVSYKGPPYLATLAYLKGDGTYRQFHAAIPEGIRKAEDVFLFMLAGSSPTPATRMRLLQVFRQTPLIVDMSVFSNPTAYFRDTPDIEFDRRTAAFELGDRARVLWTESFFRAPPEYRLVEHRREGRADKEYFILLREPAVLGSIPPGSFKQDLDRLARTPFSQKDFSVVLLENNTDARRSLLAARGDGSLNVAADYGGAQAFGAAELRALESEFAVRRGKSIGVIGHFDGTDFHVRSGAQTVGRISAATLASWGEKYGVDLLFLGCNTIAGTGAAIKTVTPINSLETADALVRAVRAGNWADFVSMLSSESNPIVFNWTGLAPKGFDRAQLYGKLPDGRLSLVATVLFRVRCAVISKC